MLFFSFSSFFIVSFLDKWFKIILLFGIFSSFSFFSFFSIFIFEPLDIKWKCFLLLPIVINFLSSLFFTWNLDLDSPSPTLLASELSFFGLNIFTWWLSLLYFFLFFLSPLIVSINVTFFGGKFLLFCLFIFEIYSTYFFVKEKIYIFILPNSNIKYNKTIAIWTAIIKRDIHPPIDLEKCLNMYWKHLNTCKLLELMKSKNCPNVSLRIVSFNNSLFAISLNVQSHEAVIPSKSIPLYWQSLSHTDTFG